MSFSFNFQNEDIDPDHDDSPNPAPSATAPPNPHPQSPPSHLTTKVQEHDLDALLSTLPSHLSYSTLRLVSPSATHQICLPRRDLYDVRVQLLQEGLPRNDEVIDQIEKSDLRSGVYEGGFKTWECALDLAGLLLDRASGTEVGGLAGCDRVIELGAGTAIPSLVLFRHALRNDLPVTFSLADFNDSVLRLVTLPNLILTWASVTSGSGFAADVTEETKDELDLTPELLHAFKSDLNAKGIELKFLSGPWSERLAWQFPRSAPDMSTLILASETIYSLDSTGAFADLLVIVLQQVKTAKAILAAKRMYFGVGGSVDAFKEACSARGAVASEIENHGMAGMDRAGVERALVVVQMA